jgi:hypothetical protein
MAGNVFDKKSGVNPTSVVAINAGNALGVG